MAFQATISPLPLPLAKLPPKSAGDMVEYLFCTPRNVPKPGARNCGARVRRFKSCQPHWEVASSPGSVPHDVPHQSGFRRLPTGVYDSFDETRVD